MVCSRGKQRKAPPDLSGGAAMTSGRGALDYATDSGRPSGRAGAGKVEKQHVPRLGHGSNVPGGAQVCQASLSLPLVNRPPVILSFVLLLASIAGPLAGQGLPPYAPINPMADSRTPLGFEPYR